MKKTKKPFAIALAALLCAALIPVTAYAADATATISDGTVSGTVGTPITSPPFTITLTGDTFNGNTYNDIHAGTGLSISLIATNGNTTGTLTFSGTPTTPTTYLSEIITNAILGIPGTFLTSGNTVYFTANPNAKLNIVAAGGAPSSDASLISVAGQTITVVGGTGASTDPKTASITVPYSKTQIENSDIVAAAGADIVICDDDTFLLSTTGTASINVGTNHVYVYVRAEDGTTACYYDITVTRQADSTPSTPAPPHFQNDDNDHVIGEDAHIIHITDIDIWQHIDGEVYVDNVQLTHGTHYTATEGSTIITLLKDYLDTLSVGWHDLRIHFETDTPENDVVETRFYIHPRAATPPPSTATGTGGGTAATGGSPKTADETNPALWLTLMLIALVGARLASPAPARKREQ